MGHGRHVLDPGVAVNVPGAQVMQATGSPNDPAPQDGIVVGDGDEGVADGRDDDGVDEGSEEEGADDDGDTDEEG